MNDVWVVIPAYNEERKIGEVVRAVLAHAPKVVVVDDGSADRTFEAASSLPVDVLRHRLNRGQGAALATGIEYALRRGAGIIVTFDADGQHDPAEIASLIKPIVEGKAQVALGSRFLGPGQPIPWVRRLVLKAGILFTRVLSRIDVSDTHNGFRALSAAAARSIEITQDRMAHASEIIDQIARKKIPFVEVPVTICYSDYSRQKGQSSLNAVRIALRMILGKLR